MSAEKGEFCDRGKRVVRAETVPALSANVVAFVMLLPIVVVCVAPFVLLWGWQLLFDGFRDLAAHRALQLLLLLLGVVLHEGLHGLTWAIFARGHLKSIRFGIKWAYLTPFCHCTEPLKRNHYLLGGAMPGLVLGLFPVFLAIALGLGWLLLPGILFIGAAGGDIMVLSRLVRVDRGHWVQDHPSEIGFLVLEATP